MTQKKSIFLVTWNDENVGQQFAFVSKAEDFEKQNASIYFNCFATVPLL